MSIDEMADPAIAPDSVNAGSAGPDWALIKADYDAGLGTEKEIQALHGVTKGEFDYRKRLQDWPPRRAVAGVSRASIIRRMFRVVNAHIVKLETNVNTAGPDEIALLGSLTTTLGKLVEFDKARTRPKKAKASKALEELKSKIAHRIEQLNQG